MSSSTGHIAGAHLNWINHILAILFIIGSGIIPPGANAGVHSSPRLVIFQNFVLLAYYDNRYLEIKRLPPNTGGFYGYGWVNKEKDKIFVAYQPPNAGDAVADIELVDLKDKRIVKLEGIGQMGDSSFSVNASRGAVIYDNPVLRNDAKSAGIVLMAIDMDSNNYRSYHINNVPCWAPFWIDDHTGGCIVFNDKENKRNFVKFRIPDVDELKKNGIKGVSIPWYEQ